MYSRFYLHLNCGNVSNEKREKIKKSLVKLSGYSHAEYCVEEGECFYFFDEGLSRREVLDITSKLCFHGVSKWEFSNPRINDKKE